MSDKNPRYARILLKLSGEALAGSKDMGIDSDVLDLVKKFVSICLVIYRKKSLSAY